VGQWCCGGKGAENNKRNKWQNIGADRKKIKERTWNETMARKIRQNMKKKMWSIIKKKWK
jgi:hypothetical protein